MEFKHSINNECAFNKDQKTQICSNEEIIEKIKEIAIDDKVIIKNSSTETLFNELKKKYNCNSESCILKQDEISSKIPKHLLNENLENNFKPIGPKYSTEWLSNVHIDTILSQLTKKFKDFYHILFQMRDFEKTNSELANIDFYTKYNEGYRTFGTVINTDYSTGSGIHWFAMFMDFRDENTIYTIEYFNSSGEPPLDEISIWMQKIKHKLNKIGMKKQVDIKYTNIGIPFQRDNHSCGPYSIYYIFSRLHNISYKQFSNKNIVSDNKMIEFRKYIFRDEK
jgi:hypothetical protein